MSEHHGDGSPGAIVRIETGGLDDDQKHLSGKNYKFARPGIEETPYGLREMKIDDPFGNRLIFFEPKA